SPISSSDAPVSSMRFTNRSSTSPSNSTIWAWVAVVIPQGGAHAAPATTAAPANPGAPSHDGTRRISENLSNGAAIVQGDGRDRDTTGRLRFSASGGMVRLDAILVHTRPAGQRSALVAVRVIEAR